MAQAKTKPSEQAGLPLQQTEKTRKQQFEDAFGFSPDDPFSLEAVVSSKCFPPQKVVIYGVPGVGKTTMASTWPKPILLRTEDGAGALDIPTFPQIARSLDDVGKAITALQRSNHQYRTLIIDSLDWLEPLVAERVCQQDGKVNIEDFGFGKGYIKMDAKWRQVQAELDKLRENKNMHIVCIAHAVPTMFDPPDSDGYMKYSIKLQKRGAALWMEWSEMLLFVNYQSTVIAAKENAKAKARGSGERIIYTQERPAYQAKSRWPLPDTIFIGNDPTWAAFHTALNEASEGAYSNGD